MVLQVTVLGPERPTPVLPSVLTRLGLRGPVALITAGWRFDEPRDEPLRAAVGVTVHNLGLYAAFREIERAAPDLMSAYARKQALVKEARGRYRIAITGAVETCQRLLADKHDYQDPWFRAAVGQLQALDQHWIDHTDRLHRSFEEEMAPKRHRLIRAYRARIFDVLAGCEAVMLAGGHVGVLRNRISFFGLDEELGQRRVIAWSAGAMVLCEHILLYHDHTNFGVGTAEVFDRGLGLLPGVYLLPHARQRLLLDAPDNVAILAQRLAPRVSVGLQNGAVLENPHVGGQHLRNGELPNGELTRQHQHLRNSGVADAAFTLSERGTIEPLERGHA